ncbi:DUF5956 family protein [Arthrobacter sp. Hz1]
MTLKTWAAVPLAATANREAWIEATNNGWGALVLWVSEPRNLIRQPGQSDQGQVVQTVTANGVTTTHEIPLTVKDFQESDEDVDTYLSEAGIPPRPRGFIWYIHLPPGVNSEREFWSILNQAIADRAPEARRPSQFLPQLADALASLYS